MAPMNRIIIDTDPGVDDILAILLALAASPEEVEVLLLSVVFGNIDVEACLRNVVTMFHIIDEELSWRRNHGLPEGFASLKSFRPLVAVGMEKPLADQLIMADYFHGPDGLGGIHSSHPHFTPQETWRMLFHPSSEDPTVPQIATPAGRSSLPGDYTSLMTPSKTPAHREILRILRENEPDTITVVAIGPLTNIALAAAEDPEVFLRVKELVVMGGAIDLEGNVTPVAEFNLYADSIAAARVFALTSPQPSSTLPPNPPYPTEQHLPAYPEPLSRKLNLTLFPLDITTPHILYRSELDSKLQPLIQQGSPLASWVRAFLRSTFHKIESLVPHEESDSEPDSSRSTGLSLHDPLCIWYVLTSSSPTWLSSLSEPEDIRIETSGQWTRGMCIVDRRSRRRATEATEIIPGDTYDWLGHGKGNRIRRMRQSPGQEIFAGEMLRRIFG
ncbi:MAG: hypothetical protein M1816_005028 [Peltula sp. TS41687]|nr:MAG: hypothetical protein M1816_005028 [Peltula sp. TS41687]